MKIKDNTKGIYHNPDGVSDEEYLASMIPDDDYLEYLAEQDDHDYLQDMYDRNEQAQAEWEKQGEENLKILLNKQKVLVEQFKKDQAKAKAKGKEISYSGASYIGERIEYLMIQNNQEITEFCKNIGISRSSLHRYIKGTFLPTEKTLRKIIEGLFVSVADFCYEPDDYDKWKKELESSNDSNDVFRFKEEVLKKLRMNSFTYQNNGIAMRLPNRYFELLRNIINSSFGVLELLPHDEYK